MNIDETICDHKEVRVLLSSYISKSTAQSMGLFAIGRETNCPLGEWIYKHRTVNGVANLPEYQALAAAHQQFHITAHDVIKLAMAGMNVDAVELLDGHYTEVEATLVAAIQALGDTQQD